MNRMKLLKEELLHDKLAIISVCFLSVLILGSIFAFLSPYDPNATNISSRLQAPSLLHWFGTDDLGRDYFTRALFGGRVSLTVGVLAMLLSSVIGVTVGTLAGYYGGILDNILMRIVDIFLSIPWIVFVTVISLFLKPGITAVIIVIGCFSWLRMARLVRGETLTLKEREYVLYAHATGQSDFKIIFKHIVLAALPTIIVASTINIAQSIIMESTLSFFGLGVQQPMSSWGSMLQSAQSSLETAPYMSIFPGLLIVITVYSFSKLGDVLRTLVEPSLQK